MAAIQLALSILKYALEASAERHLPRTYALANGADAMAARLYTAAGDERPSPLSPPLSFSLFLSARRRSAVDRENSNNASLIGSALARRGACRCDGGGEVFMAGLSAVFDIEIPPESDGDGDSRNQFATCHCHHIHRIEVADSFFLLSGDGGGDFFLRRESARAAAAVAVATITTSDACRAVLIGVLRPWPGGRLCHSLNYAADADADAEPAGRQGGEKQFSPL